MSFRVRHIARNVVWNWVATATSMLVAFFLSPFIVHRLGNTAYGIWVIIGSVISYSKLADLGMRTSLLRFVSKSYAQEDHEVSSRMLSAALWIRLWISAGIILASIVLSIGVPHWFSVPPELQRATQLSFLVLGVTTAMTMSLGVVGIVLTALNRYDVQSWTLMVQTAFRVLGIVYLLGHGYGILAIALCEFVAAAIYVTTLLYAAHKIYPQLTLRLHRPERATISRLWSYSVWVFLNSIAVQLVYYTDNVVVGAIASATAVTFYSIASVFCRYTEQITYSVSSTFNPVASMLEAQGRTSGLRKLYIQGTRLVLTVTLPICITLFLRGETFINLWMGPSYGPVCSPILRILIFPVAWGAGSTMIGALSYAMEKHKIPAYWAVGEGIANLGLSVVLGHYYGPIGVAVGTLIPSFVIHVFLWPSYLPKLTDLGPKDIIGSVWGPLILASIPFVTATWLVDKYLSPQHLISFFLQCFGLLVIFGAAVLFAFREDFVPIVKDRMRAFHANAETSSS